ncbi:MULTISPECIES: TfoX/Sxy family protein [unclassified Sphingomonas]|uniref:TfoX/Sxy family protein n=1 Tax=unclassified Sphingomonas TaxID=196159 RepID=UPI000926FB94|nr:MULTISPECIES: TfoX/Sxy family protein [unclassified Sphingomonas]MBN8849339.1 TfoX/Sxy family protein [Sphingomonas sp.]OJV34467.1 MAG: competence protein TfoX [Sphingomonas sp. 67-36]
MSIDAGLADWVEEAMAPIGTVTRKRLFGGAALYCDGLTFAIIAFDVLWFKADAQSAAAWDAIDAPLFTVTRDNGRVQSLPYRRAPDDVYDDPEALRDWAMLALEAARRAPPKPALRRKRAARG